MNHSISEMMTSSMEKLQQLVDVNTIVGKPITTPEGVTIIPVSKVKIGMGGGGSDFTTKTMKADRDNPFGGGMGCGVNIDPVAFLVVRGESVRMLPVAEPASTTVDRLIEKAPEFADRLMSLLGEKSGAEG